MAVKLQTKNSTYRQNNWLLPIIVKILGGGAFLYKKYSRPLIYLFPSNTLGIFSERINFCVNFEKRKEGLYEYTRHNGRLYPNFFMERSIESTHWYVRGGGGDRPNTHKPAIHKLSPL